MKMVDGLTGRLPVVRKNIVSFRGECIYDGLGYDFCRLDQIQKFFIRHLDERLAMSFWQHECMSEMDRIDVEDCHGPLILIDDLRG